MMKVFFTDKSKSVVNDAEFLTKIIQQTSPNSFPLRVVPVSGNVTAIMSGNTTLVTTNAFQVTRELRVYSSGSFASVDSYIPAVKGVA